MNKLKLMIRAMNGISSICISQKCENVKLIPKIRPILNVNHIFNHIPIKLNRNFHTKFTLYHFGFQTISSFYRVLISPSHRYRPLAQQFQCYSHNCSTTQRSSKRCKMKSIMWLVKVDRQLWMIETSKFRLMPP